MSRQRPRVQQGLELVDPETTRRVQALVGRVRVKEAKRLLAVSDFVFDSLRYSGAVQPALLTKIRERLDAIERGEVAA